MGVNYRGLSIPFTRMGKITSDNLFDPNEQVIFDFYEANRFRYRRVLDIGANLGVHTIIMARLGWQVRAFEPDPHHFEILRNNLAIHKVRVRARQAAVSDRNGTARFVRVLDNTTGSHLDGVKDSYGPRQYFDVTLIDCRPLFMWADFAKIDCEGGEAALVLASSVEMWRSLEAMLEVGSADNAESIYRHLHSVPMWSQKTGWKRVRELADVPAHHSEGSLFIGQKPPFM